MGGGGKVKGCGGSFEIGQLAVKGVSWGRKKNSHQRYVPFPVEGCTTPWGKKDAGESQGGANVPYTVCSAKRNKRRSWVGSKWGKVRGRGRKSKG